MHFKLFWTPTTENEKLAKEMNGSKVISISSHFTYPGRQYEEYNSLVLDYDANELVKTNNSEFYIIGLLNNYTISWDTLKYINRIMGYYSDVVSMIYIDTNNQNNPHYYSVRNNDDEIAKINSPLFINSKFLRHGYYTTNIDIFKTLDQYGVIYHLPEVLAWRNYGQSF